MHRKPTFLDLCLASLFSLAGVGAALYDYSPELTRTWVLERFQELDTKPTLALAAEEIKSKISIVKTNSDLKMRTETKLAPTRRVAFIETKSVLQGSDSNDDDVWVDANPVWKRLDPWADQWIDHELDELDGDDKKIDPPHLHDQFWDAATL